MRTRTWMVVLSAMASLGAAACFPEYSFDLTELDEVDASADANDASVTDSDTSADADIDAADADDGAATDPDASADAGDDAADADDGSATDPDASADAGDDAATDSGTSADAGEDAATDAGPDASLPEPNCGEGAIHGDAYECVESPPPTGWTGPVALFSQVVGVPVPPCPSLFTETPLYDGHEELNPTEATCSKCTCSNVKGVSCSIPKDEFWSAPACSGCGWVADDAEPTQNWGECFGWRFPKPPGCDSPRSVRLGPSNPTAPGSCTASSQSPVIPPAFSDNARACHAPSSTLGCAAGFVCAPKLNDDYRQMCIIKVGTGEADCPAGAYSEKRVFYRNATDTRGCTDCQCGTPTGVQCNAVLKTYSNTRSCANEDGTIAADSCGAFPPAVDNPDNGSEWVKSFKFESHPTGICAASGGQPTGTVQVSGTAQTICCKP